MSSAKSRPNLPLQVAAKRRAVPEQSVRHKECAVLALKAFYLTERKPTVEELATLRSAVGWRIPDPAYVDRGLNNSSYVICALMDGKVVGTTRVVGDCNTCFYIQDVIVMPEYQRTGIGTAMMEKTLKYVEANACRGAVIGLMSAKGKEAFYERFGFWKRPVGNFGHGMMQYWGSKNGD